MSVEALEAEQIDAVREMPRHSLQAERSRSLLAGAVLVFVIAATVLSFRPWRSDDQADATIAATRTRVLLDRKPYLGVACPQENDITCNRVKIAIWTTKPVRHVAASIDDRYFETGALGLGNEPLGKFWQGVLQPAGLRRGPLRPPSDVVQDGLWFGESPPTVDVRIEIQDEDRVVVRIVSVTLSPAYG